ncbi:MAG: hypothetical protein C4B59_15895 [Candidatus Methanogaster sp.]|uniref:Uncharacterized protein n=1 Tax=Candidatus Methanogaster sp. TaxID=3386292 RepID=A0AC61KYR9_9EURY|nr:MAG: hypothetical protein C4B59_15895 [ANME-2 cluster archaeon]
MCNHRKRIPGLQQRFHASGRFKLTREHILHEQDVMVRFIETTVATIDPPSSFLTATKVKEDEIDIFIRQLLAVGLCREGTLSLGKAAEVAIVRNKWEMLLPLNEKGIPIDNTAKDAKRDLETLKKCWADDDHGLQFHTTQSHFQESES